MVFVFDSNRPRDKFDDAVLPRPFRLFDQDGTGGGAHQKKIGITLGEKALAGARLRLRVHASGRAKMKANWIYQAAKTN